MSVSIDDFNALVERVRRLESLVDSDWAQRFTPAQGPIAPPSQPPAPQTEVEEFPGGGNTLMRVQAATTERVHNNCIFFNTGNEEDSTTTYFAHTKNMRLVRAVYDATLEPGTLQANMYTRLNLELPLGKVCDFLKMGDPIVCAKLSARVIELEGSSINTVPLEEVKVYLEGTFVNTKEDIFLFRKGDKTYQVKVNEMSGDGILTKDTEFILN